MLLRCTTIGLALNCRKFIAFSLAEHLHRTRTSKTSCFLKQFDKYHIRFSNISSNYEHFFHFFRLEVPTFDTIKRYLFRVLRIAMESDLKDWPQTAAVDFTQFRTNESGFSPWFKSPHDWFPMHSILSENFSFMAHCPNSDLFTRSANKSLKMFFFHYLFVRSNSLCKKQKRKKLSIALFDCDNSLRLLIIPSMCLSFLSSFLHAP